MQKFPHLHPLIQAQLDNGQLSHAYIFRGQESLDQARTLSAVLNCTAKRSDQPCSQCQSCQNILAGTYPDLHIIEPDKGSHRLENIKAMSSIAGLSSLNDAWKIFIITEAEKLTDESANNLLKLLEEPPAKTIFILLCDQPEQLLPTVLSRCQLFVLDNTFGQDETAVAKEAVAEAGELLTAFAGMSIYEVLMKARDREKREDQHDFLLAILHVLHDAILGKRALPMPYAYLLRSATMVESSLELISNNINQKLLMDVVYLRLWQNSQH